MAGVAQFLKSFPEPGFPLAVWVHIDEGSVSHEIMHLGGSSVTDTQIEHFRGLTGFHESTYARRESRTRASVSLRIAPTCNTWIFPVHKSRISVSST